MGYWRLWVMGLKSPPTELVDQKMYGVCPTMGFLGYGLSRVRLYISQCLEFGWSSGRSASDNYDEG